MYHTFFCKPRVGRSSLVIRLTNSWLTGHKFEPSIAEEPPSVEAQTSSHKCGAEGGSTPQFEKCWTFGNGHRIFEQMSNEEDTRVSTLRIPTSRLHKEFVSQQILRASQHGMFEEALGFDHVPIERILVVMTTKTATDAVTVAMRRETNTSRFVPITQTFIGLKQRQRDKADFFVAKHYTKNKNTTKFCCIKSSRVVRLLKASCMQPLGRGLATSGLGVESYTRAFGDGPRNFEPWSSDEDDTGAITPLLTTTPHQRKDVRALDRFNVHRSPTRWVFSGTGLKLMTCQPRSDTLTTRLPRPPRTRDTPATSS
ncbi:hypothetical protein TNCV_3553641 [Trichonephila clavipes]|nr:hypothetical protein TNCV_3553641 [Trichonephila clavipes]